MRLSIGRQCLAAAVAAVIPLVSAAPATGSTWSSATSSRTGTLGMAVPAHRFSGPVPDSYTIGYTVINFVDTAYPVFTNTGSTPASFSGPVLHTGNLPLGSTVSVKACTVPWTLGSCPAGETVLLTPTALSPAPTVTYQRTPISAGGRTYLQVKVGGFLATATVTLTVTRFVLPAGGTDRSAG